ncbi:flavin-nucleotide-binding protein [Pigmentiphaga aceris]|uniref:Flavin-nucleotide-binding protein n=1 Tax=Pigmentiphaga aceris TaxID=1940612 RepID=A0A5C0B1L8_9BURK|nr:pyridoxamine 5'-phosphate oxidase family protein [Pigmentiphaga aceris]QEI06537.1 flavin-nucleotide-binding protein [Pigmentiphaga aceris]
MHDASTSPTFPWHAGEIQLQQRVGVAKRMLELGPRWIRQTVPEQFQDFLSYLPFVVVGAVDAEGNAWASLLAGEAGFVHATDARHVSIAMPRDASDPADVGMSDGLSMGLLGIDLAHRHRIRVNGKVRRTTDDSFSIEVAQSFGNCPQYIHPRHIEQHAPAADVTVRRAQYMTQLDPALAAMVTQADTFFVASYADTDDGRQVDVSHRGGRAGFVHVGNDGVLTIPDYAGNRFFNTLGNLLVNPRAGLLFVDFASGSLLHLTGDAEVMPDRVGTADFPGAERLWRFTPRQVVYRANALPLRWRAV